MRNLATVPNLMSMIIFLVANKVHFQRGINKCLNFQFLIYFLNKLTFFSKFPDFFLTFEPNENFLTFY